MTTLWDCRSPSSVLAEAFNQFPRAESVCLLASPFFTDVQIITNLLARGHEVRLIVRLGEITSPAALAQILPNQRCMIRYFTNERFHSKLYILGSEIALVGSGNLTDGGLIGNAEVALSINDEHPDFEGLVRLFQSYWDSAKPLDGPTLSLFKAAVNSGPAGDSGLTKRVKDALGDVAPPNHFVTKRSRSQDDVFKDEFRRARQTFDTAFNHLRSRYELMNFRKVAEGTLPLRLEVDQFLSWLRETHVVGETYAEQPERHGSDLDGSVDRFLFEWKDAPYSHLDDGEAISAYQRLNNSFGSVEAIHALTQDQIFDALYELNSVRERRRYFKGGRETFRKEFLKANNQKRMQDAISFILHGPGDPVDRMAKAIYRREYGMENFGRSNVQELYGSVNTRNSPVCNGRTVKAMRYLGYSVQVFN
jgi:hypothetical protein